MRHIRRKGEPDLLETPLAREVREQLRRFHTGGGTRGGQGVLDFETVFGELRRTALADAAVLEPTFGGICAYTEQALEVIATKTASGGPLPTMHLHRPPRDALGADEAISPDHYWWLAVDWTNWYLVDADVARRKLNRFPVFGSRSDASIAASGGVPRKDRGVLLDPCVDHPQWWLAAQPDGTFGPGVRSVRGAGDAERTRTTVTVLGLNDPTLVEQRRDAAWIRGVDTPFAGFTRQRAAQELLIEGGNPIPELWRELAEEVVPRLLASPPTGYVPPVPAEVHEDLRRAARRIGARKAEREDLDVLMEAGGSGQQAGGAGHDAPAPPPTTAEPVADDDAPTVIPRDAVISQVEIRNFRCLELVRFEISSSGVRADEVDLPIDPDHAPATPVEPCVMLLGENGSGKSSVLQAIALALAGDQLDALLADTGLVWRKMLRWGQDEGHVSITFSRGERIELRFTATGHEFVGGVPTINLPVRAMGAARSIGGRAPGAPDSTTAQHDVRNLFDPLHEMVDVTEWLRSLQTSRIGDFNVAMATLRQFLQLQEGAELTLGSDDLEVEGVELGMLSDGYRSVIALVCAIMSVAQLDISDTGSTRGVMLIDEIGAHLHPAWKRRITGLLRERFRNLQFLITTHEPLCLRGMHTHEVVLVTRSEDAPSAFEVIPRSPSRYRVDQLLTSEFFGLGTTLDPAEQQKLDQYLEALRVYEAARDRGASADELRPLRDAAAALRPAPTHGVLGVTRREQLAFEAIDHYLAAHGRDRAELPDARRAARAKAIADAVDILRLEVPAPAALNPSGPGGDGS